MTKFTKQVGAVLSCASQTGTTKDKGGYHIYEFGWVVRFELFSRTGKHLGTKYIKTRKYNNETFEITPLTHYDEQTREVRSHNVGDLKFRSHSTRITNRNVVIKDI